MTQLSSIGQQLRIDLGKTRSQNESRGHSHIDSQKVHVVGAGAAVTAAYEQLRNAAEYTEEHVLLQRAIRRFYRRLFVLNDERQIFSSGDDLIVELTHAGYLQNDSIDEQASERISALARQYYAAYVKLHRTTAVSGDQADKWTYEVLAVEVESLLNDNAQLEVITQFAYSYFADTLPYEQIFLEKPKDADTALYVAIHRSLLKSDDALVRFRLLQRYQLTAADLEKYTSTNKLIDELLLSKTTEKLAKIVDRRSAPLRVLRHMIDEQKGIEELMSNREQFLLQFENQVNTDYVSINKRVNNGIVKSVIFLIITKFLIGLAIEIPYDYFVLGMIVWVPLLVNLLFPPLYMILLRATMMLPGAANTRRLVTQIDTMLYAPKAAKNLMRRKGNEFGAGFNIAYGMLFALVFGGVALFLWRVLGFDIVHLGIFFIFLSAASFLGFRLSRIIREIESLETHQNGVTLLRDFLYMPFVVVGRYLSDKYAKVNLVALALDMLIELPLKTILRLVRQWAAFISAKKDQL